MAVTLSAGGRVMTLRYDVASVIEIEDELGSTAEFSRRLNENDRPYQANLALISACINGGMRREGSAERVTPGWVAEHLSPREVNAAKSAAMRAFVLGMRRLHAEDEDEDVDVVAEEIKKKEENAAGAR